MTFCPYPLPLFSKDDQKKYEKKISRISEVYSGPSQTSMTEFFLKIDNGF